MLRKKDKSSLNMIKNNNNYFSFAFRISKYIPQISITSFLFLLLLINSSNIITAFGQQSNSQSENENINIAVAGDFYCNDQTEELLKILFH